MQEKGILRICYTDSESPFLRRYADLVARQVQRRCPTVLEFNGATEPHMTWEVDGALEGEAFVNVVSALVNRFIDSRLQIHYI